MAAGFYSEYVDRDEQRYDKKQNSDPPVVDQYDGGEHHRAPHRDQGRGLDPARYAASLLVIEQVMPENPVAVQPAIAHRIAPGETVCRQQQKRSRRYQRNESPDESPSDERVCGDFQQFLFHVVLAWRARYEKSKKRLPLWSRNRRFLRLGRTMRRGRDTIKPRFLCQKIRCLPVSTG